MHRYQHLQDVYIRHAMRLKEILYEVFLKYPQVPFVPILLNGHAQVSGCSPKIFDCESLVQFSNESNIEIRGVCAGQAIINVYRYNDEEI